MHGNSFDQFVKVFKVVSGKFSVWGGYVIGLCVDKHVGYGVNISYGIRSYIDDEYKLCNFIGSFKKFNDGKPVGSLLNESIE